MAFSNSENWKLGCNLKGFSTPFSIHGWIEKSKSCLPKFEQKTHTEKLGNNELSDVSKKMFNLTVIRYYLKDLRYNLSFGPALFVIIDFDSMFFLSKKAEPQDEL